jgi:hypothetical protein
MTPPQRPQRRPYSRVQVIASRCALSTEKLDPKIEADIFMRIFDA